MAFVQRAAKVAAEAALQEGAKVVVREEWTREEHARFVAAVEVHGKDWKLVAKCVGTKTLKQTQHHGRYFLRKLKREGKAIPAAAMSCGEVDLAEQLESESERAAEDSVATPEPLEPGRKKKVCKRWTSVEQVNFQIGLWLFGRQWFLVARHVGSKTSKQTADYAYKYFDKLRREGKEDLIPPELSEGKWRAPNEQELKQWLKETGLS